MINLDEVNRDLAKFDNAVYCESKHTDDLAWIEDAVFRGVRKRDLYTESLDALLPIWEKLNPDYIKIQNMTVTLSWNIERSMSRIKYWHKGNHLKATIEESAAIATWKAVKELKNGKA